MNKRYFLRGLGFGLIIGAIVMMVAFSSQNVNEASTSTPSNDIKTTSEDSSTSETKTEEPTVEPKTEEATEPETEEVPSTEEKTEKVTETDTEEATETTEPETESKTDEELTTEASTEAQKGGSVTVTSGMSAQSVAKKLHEIGMIDDEEDFYMYMYNNGYASKILQGTFTFTGDEDYEQISKILTNKS